MNDIELEIETTFTEEREEWTEKIRNHSIRLRNIREIHDVQVDLYCDRQKAIEYRYKLGQIISAINSKYRTDKKIKMEYYTLNSNVKYGANEKTVLIEGDLSMIKRKLDSVDNHAAFMNETIKTLDHLLYGIKARVQLETFMRGGE